MAELPRPELDRHLSIYNHCTALVGEQYFKCLDNKTLDSFHRHNICVKRLQEQVERCLNMYKDILDN